MFSHTDQCGDTDINVSINPSTITSPGWPERYSGKIDCIWSVIAAVGYQVVLKFHEFRVNTGAFLQCGNGNGSSYPITEIIG